VVDTRRVDGKVFQTVGPETAELCGCSRNISWCSPDVHLCTTAQLSCVGGFCYHVWHAAERFHLRSYLSTARWDWEWNLDCVMEMQSTVADSQVFN